MPEIKTPDLALYLHLAIATGQSFCHDLLIVFRHFWDRGIDRWYSVITKTAVEGRVKVASMSH